MDGHPQGPAASPPVLNREKAEIDIGSSGVSDTHAGLCGAARQPRAEEESAAGRREPLLTEVP